MSWILVFFEYLKTTKSIPLLVNLAVSIALSSAMFYFPTNIEFSDLMADFISQSVSVLALLVGFTLAMFSMLLTGSNPNIDAIKTSETEYRLYGEQVSIYNLLLIRIVYVIIIESILLLFNLLYPFFFNLYSDFGKVFFAIDAFLLIHIILVNVNTTIDLYFVLTKTKKKKS